MKKDYSALLPDGSSYGFCLSLTYGSKKNSFPIYMNLLPILRK